MKNETWFVLKQDSLNHTLAEYVCTRRRFKVNRVKNEILYKYTHTKRKKKDNYFVVSTRYEKLYFSLHYIFICYLLHG